MNLPGVRSRHLHLLRAALGQGRDVRIEWNAWRRTANLLRLDHGSSRLLPLAYHNLVEHDVPDAEIPPRVPGVARHTWTRNQTLIRLVEPALDALRDGDIDFLVIKGAALLIAAYGGDTRLRPLGDVDVLVRPEAMTKAAACLVNAGWTRRPPDIDDAWLFAVEGGYRIRLHQNALLEATDRGLAEPPWDRAEWAEFANGPVRIPDPTSLLLQAVVYGHFPPLPLPIRWIADAARLIRVHGTRMDEPDFFRRVERLGVAPHARAALAALAPFAKAPLWPHGLRESGRLEFEVTRRLQRWCGQTPRWWFHARRRRVPFLRYLARMFGLDRGRDLPLLLVRKAVHRWLRVLRIRFD